MTVAQLAYWQNEHRIQQEKRLAAEAAQQRIEELEREVATQRQAAKDVGSLVNGAQARAETAGRRYTELRDAVKKYWDSEGSRSLSYRDADLQAALDRLEGEG